MPIASIACLPSVLLVQGPDGGWTPGIGDPTPIGWFTVAAYFTAAGLCYAAHGAATRRMAREPQLAAVWLLLCVGLMLLGINKQLDLQSWFTVVGRRMAIEGGWYEQRGLYQVWFIRGILLLGVIGGAVATWLVRRSLRELWLAVVGGAFLVAFVVIRAASFHHVDFLLKGGYHGLPLNAMFELSGIACVGLSAAVAAKRKAA